MAGNIQDDFLSLDRVELSRVARTLKKIRSMDWNTFIKHRGWWEKVEHVIAPNGKPATPFG